MVPITLVSWALCALTPRGSTISPACTTVSSSRVRTRRPIDLWRRSARRKSVRCRYTDGARAPTATIRSTDGSVSSAAARRAPRNRETPVIRTRRVSGTRPMLTRRDRSLGLAWPRRPWSPRCERRRRAGSPCASAPRPDLLVAPGHHLAQPRVHLTGTPEVRLDVLHPFEVRDDNTAGIGEDVRQDEHAARVELGVRLGGERCVGALRDRPSRARGRRCAR